MRPRLLTSLRTDPWRLVRHDTTGYRTLLEADFISFSLVIHGTLHPSNVNSSCALAAFHGYLGFGSLATHLCAVIIYFRVYLFIGHFVRKSTFWIFLVSYSWRVATVRCLQEIGEATMGEPAP